jgi:hypothetical protein
MLLAWYTIICAIWPLEGTHLPEAKFRKKKNYIYSTKFFHNFHLSESSFTCPGLRASGLARGMEVCLQTCISMKLLEVSVMPSRLPYFCKCGDWAMNLTIWHLQQLWINCIFLGKWNQFYLSRASGKRVSTRNGSVPLLISFIFNFKFMLCTCIFVVGLIFVDFRFYSFRIEICNIHVYIISKCQLFP